MKDDTPLAVDMLPEIENWLEYMKEQLSKEVIEMIIDSLQNSIKGNLETMLLDKEREQFKGMGVNENLIPRKKQELFSEIDAKRNKLLAGLL